MTKIKLFCFPYAGGSARFYKGWQKYFPAEIEVVPIDPPGRGRRFGMDYCQSVEAMVDDIFAQVKDQLLHGNYALFGHSMGAVVTHELAYRIREAHLPDPLHLFLSGRGAPQIPDEEDKEKIHLLPDEQFKHKLIEYGGTPEEVLANQELMSLFLPILRADFRVCDEYDFKDPDYKFDYGITVLTGLEEKITEEQIHGWQQFTEKKIKINRFPGGHFFLHHETLNVVRIISQTLFKIMEERIGEAM